MGSFDYLSVLISIVLGLGLTNLLAGLAALVRQRGRLIGYWPLPTWMVTVFLIHVQTWWALFGLRDMQRWSFAAFLVVLLQPVALFVMTALIAPDLSSTGKVDLRAGYFRETRWFFGALIFALLASLGKNLILTGAMPEGRNLGAHILFIVIALVGGISRNGRVHSILAPLGLGLLACYIGLLFTTLS
jgi:hypothetical protein